MDDATPVYLDYNATTPLEGEVADAIHSALKNAWANPSSTYPPGVAAKKIIEQARSHIAEMIHAPTPDDIVLMSGGTEGNNQVIQTALQHFRESGRPGLPHVITSCLEHDSVRLPLAHLKARSQIELTTIPAHGDGAVVAEEVIAAVTGNTCLVTIMLANNETGIIQPISEVFHGIKKKWPHVLLHTDAAQALGKIPVHVTKLMADYVTIVGHKFYGPRIGALYVRGIGKETPLHPLFHGGGQERNYRPGTENTGMIAGLGKAAELVVKHLPEYEQRMRDVRDYLEQRLQAVFGDGVCFNGKSPKVQRLPNTCNFSFIGPQYNGRAVLAACKVTQASVGAACHSATGRGSAILLAMGISEDIACNALRFSVGRHTSREDIDRVIEDLQRARNTLSAN